MCMDTRGEEKKTTSQQQYGHGEDKTGGGGLYGDGSTTSGKIWKNMKKYEMTADMAENTQYMEMMEKTGPQTCGVGI